MKVEFNHDELREVPTEVLQKASKKYYYKHRENCLQRVAKYKEKNREHIIKTNREIQKKRYAIKGNQINEDIKKKYATDKEFKHKSKIRALTRHFQKRDKVCKICGEAKYRLEFHHLKYNSLKAITLCASCHRKVDLGVIKLAV